MMETDSDTKQRIMESAREEFFRHGFTKVTVEEIAAKNGISKKTIYKYFDGKLSRKWPDAASRLSMKRGSTTLTS
jgi:AcrR family transcriptional regulator